MNTRKVKKPKANHLWRRGFMTIAQAKQTKKSGVFPSLDEQGWSSNTKRLPRYFPKIIG